MSEGADTQATSGALHEMDSWLEQGMTNLELLRQRITPILEAQALTDDAEKVPHDVTSPIRDRARRLRHLVLEIEQLTQQVDL